MNDESLSFALSFSHSENRLFPNSAVTGMEFFIGMFVFFFPTNVSFVNFDNAFQERIV